MTVDEAVKKYNRFMGSGALRKMAQSILEEDEEAFYAYVGLCIRDGGEDECLLVATQKRVLCCSRKLVAREAHAIPLKDIHSMQIELGKGIVRKHLRIEGMIETIIIVDILSELTAIQKILQYLIDNYDEINEAMEGDGQSNEINEEPTQVTAQFFNATSATQELREWKALLDEGAITEEEYNAKKQQLLGL